MVMQLCSTRGPFIALVCMIIPCSVSASCSLAEPTGFDIFYYRKTKKEWYCNGEDAAYCSCYYEGDEDTAYTWVCDVIDSEECTVGSPPCQYGKCKDTTQACGNQWAVDPTAATCATLFGSNLYKTSYQQSCVDVFGVQAVCPGTVFNQNYQAWMNVMMSQAKIENMLRAAVLDTVWFYEKLRSMANTSNQVFLESSGLNSTKISVHFEAFRAFSCLRNLPQCVDDQRHTTFCSNKCHDVTDAINTWFNECTQLAAVGANNLDCVPLGYTRDCDGTGGVNAGAWPGLCIQFQNSALKKSASRLGIGTPLFAFALALASCRYVTAMI